MMVRFSLALCVLAYVSVTTFALESWDTAGVRIAIKVYEECSKSDGFSPCLKKKALTFFDRLSRVDKLALSEDLVIVKADDAPIANNSNQINQEQIEKSLPKEPHAKDTALDNLLYDKITSFISSRTLRFTMPKISINSLGFEEGNSSKP